jgi:hypothetical protein
MQKRQSLALLLLLARGGNHQKLVTPPPPLHFSALLFLCRAGESSSKVKCLREYNLISQGQQRLKALLFLNVGQHLLLPYIVFLGLSCMPLNAPDADATLFAFFHMLVPVPKQEDPNEVR